MARTETTNLDLGMWTDGEAPGATLKETNGNVRIPKAWLLQIVFVLFTAGVLYAAIKSSYTQTEGKVLENRVQTLEEQLRRMDAKLDILIQRK